ncbi:unnamed protein product, partial [Protopolystoma xenopodis]
SESFDYPFVSSRDSVTPTKVHPIRRDSSASIVSTDNKKGVATISLLNDHASSEGLRSPGHFASPSSIYFSPTSTGVFQSSSAENPICTRATSLFSANSPVRSFTAVSSATTSSTSIIATKGCACSVGFPLSAQTIHAKLQSGTASYTGDTIQMSSTETVEACHQPNCLYSTSGTCQEQVLSIKNAKKESLSSHTAKFIPKADHFDHPLPHIRQCDNSTCPVSEARYSDTVISFYENTTGPILPLRTNAPDFPKPPQSHKSSSSKVDNPLCIILPASSNIR